MNSTGAAEAAAVPPPALRFRPDVTMTVESPESIRLLSRQRMATVTLRGLSPHLHDVVTRLAGQGATLDELTDFVLAGGDFDELARLHYFLDSLARERLLRYSVRVGAREILAVESLTPGFEIAPVPVGMGAKFRLSRFAFCYRSGDELVLEAPLGNARVILTDPATAALVAQLAQPCTPHEIVAQNMSTEPEVLGTFAYLTAAGILGEAGTDGLLAEDRDDALALWEPHDLLFHSRSRRGRHDYPIGATYRFLGQYPPLPALKSPIAAETIPLWKPDLEQIARHDPPLTHVLEGRKSLRSYGERPLSAGQLGEFLYRAARLRGKTGINPEQGIFYEQTSRPYPNGGAAYELELYLSVRVCEGLPAGVYHYDVERHCLCRLGGADRAQPLLDDAYIASGQSAVPQVLITMTSRIGRLSWKYTGMAYATTLKNVGVLYQTMYLVATAMHLAPCALGSGNSLLVAEAFGLNALEECAVGEFMLGSAHP